jgi:hypothetical protein
LEQVATGLGLLNNVLSMFGGPAPAQETTQTPPPTVVTEPPNTTKPKVSAPVVPDGTQEAEPVAGEIVENVTTNTTNTVQENPTTLEFVWDSNNPTSADTRQQLVNALSNAEARNNNDPLARFVGTSPGGSPLYYNESALEKDTSGNIKIGNDGKPILRADVKVQCTPTAEAKSLFNASSATLSDGTALPEGITQDQIELEIAKQIAINNGVNPETANAWTSLGQANNCFDTSTELFLPAGPMEVTVNDASGNEHTVTVPLNLPEGDNPEDLKHGFEVYHPQGTALTGGANRPSTPVIPTPVTTRTYNVNLGGNRTVSVQVGPNVNAADVNALVNSMRNNNASTSPQEIQHAIAERFGPSRAAA